MVDYMGRRGVAASATKPLVADQALDHTRRRVDSTICTSMRGKLSVVVNRDQTILFAVVAVAERRATNRYADQAESIIYRIFIVIVSSCFGIVN